MNDAESRDGQGDDGSDEPERGAFDADEVDREANYVARPNYGYIVGRIPQAASAKSKPSILDGIRDFDSSKHNCVLGSIKPTEHGI